jgi:hypothetical protein
MVMTAGQVPRLLESMSVEVTHHFAAPIAAVWALLTAVERMAGLGPEHTAASWATDERGIGARFDGTNRRDEMEWTLSWFVTEWEPPVRFAWAVMEVESPSSVWSYTLREVDGGTVVVQRFEHGPNYSFIRLWAEEQPDKAEEIIEHRTQMLRDDMRTTLANAERLLITQPAASSPGP